MKIQKLLLFMFQLFCALTTCMVLFIGFRWLPFDYAPFNAIELLKIPLTAFICTLPTIIFAWGATESPLKAVFRRAIHFVLTATTVLLSVLHFYGYSLFSAWFISILLFFLVFYVLASVALELKARRIADELNKKLQTLHTGNF